ncbi:MAG: MFS transporter, partial [Nocardia sp.]|nr:MFS transporter [Nocardia sp.]
EDSNVVKIALPEIRSGLGISTPALAWVFSAYALAYGGLLLLGGRAGDILGRRRMLVWGLSLVVAASVLGGIAPNAGLLITARALQGVGFAFAGPAALSMIAVIFDEGPQRARALGVFSMVTGFGITLGLVAGGLLTSLNWRLVFFVNVPIGLVTIVLARRCLAETERRPSEFDVAGALLSTLGTVGIVYGLTRAAAAGWTDPGTLASFAAGAVLIGLFVVAERHAEQPIMPPRLLAQPARAGAYLTFVLLMATMAGTYMLLSIYLQDVLGFGPLRAGIGFLPMALAQFAAARTAPKLIARFGRAPVLIAGVVLMLLEAVWLCTTTGASNYRTGVLGPFVLLGAGLGLAFVTLNLTVLGGLEKRDTGAASGLLQAAQQIGLALGVAVLTTIEHTARTGSAEPGRAAAAQGLSGAALAAVGFAALALLIGVAMIRLPERTRPALDRTVTPARTPGEG